MCPSFFNRFKFCVGSTSIKFLSLEPLLPQDVEASQDLGFGLGGRRHGPRPEAGFEDRENFVDRDSESFESTKLKSSIKLFLVNFNERLD